MHGRRWRARGKSNLDEGITRVRPESDKSYQKKVHKRSILASKVPKYPKNKRLTIDGGIKEVHTMSIAIWHFDNKWSEPP